MSDVDRVVSGTERHECMHICIAHAKLSIIVHALLSDTLTSRDSALVVVDCSDCQIVSV